jgi:putative ABC transport system substrate-binding protein
MSIFQKLNTGEKFFRIILGLGIFLSLSSVTFAEEIAILKSADISAYSEAITAFTSALPPSFLVTQKYDLEGDMAKGRKFARRIQASNATVVLAVGLKAALAAKAEILDIPVIFCLVVDPEKYGLPTGNMVGLSLYIPFRQRLKPLQALVSNVSRIGVLYDPQKTKGMQNQLLQEAKALGIQIVSEAVHTEQDVPKALNAIKDQIDALWVLPDSTVLTENTLDFLISATLEANIPIVGFSAGLGRSGMVVGSYIHYADIGIEAAQLSQQLVNQPSSLLGKIIPPGRVYQSINKKSARYLNLPLTPDALRQFDEQF